MARKYVRKSRLRSRRRSMFRSRSRSLSAKPYRTIKRYAPKNVAYRMKSRKNTK